MPRFFVCGEFDSQECVHPVAGTSPGDGSVGSDLEPAQVVFRGVECGVAEDARVFWVLKVLALSAEAASFVLFVVRLGHSGVDLHGVVVVVIPTVRAEVAP